jgi:hypothetical protein
VTIEYAVATKNARLTAVQVQIDAAGTHGWLRLLDAFSNVLSNIVLGYPSASAANGVLTFLSPPLLDPSAALSGTAVSAIIYDGNNNQIASGLVVGSPGSGADIVLSPSNAIVAGEGVALTSATITEP